MIKKKIKDAYPLSPMQSGLLFHSILDSKSDAYIIQFIFKLIGDVDAESLKDAWQKVCDLHSVLRTGFGGQSGQTPFQYLLDCIDISFQVIDWASFGQQEQEYNLAEFLKRDRKNGFNLNKAPLFRIVLIRYSADRYDMVWTLHHILIDGWSLPIVLKDVLEAYRNIVYNTDLYLDTPRPYRDYIAWLQRQELKQAEIFWKDYLHELEGPTWLSFKEIIDKRANETYDNFLFHFSSEETDAFVKFAKENALTLNTVIQGAIGIILKTYTQQKEVILGITVSGRAIDLPGIESMVGLFINTLPLRLSFKAEETVFLFLQNLQEQSQKLNEFAYASLSQIQSWCPVDGKLFDAILVFENYPLDNQILNHDVGFKIQSVNGIEKTEYPLSIIVRPGNQLSFSISYQTEHFNEEYIKKLSEHLREVLSHFISNPEDSAERISILALKERNQVLIEWNETRVDYLKDKCFHELFEESAKAYPERIALIFEEQSLTYEQLNHHANQLAHYLRTLGVIPDTLVAISLERSLEMVIGILGILKAGGAYVPIDPAYPAERLQFMLQDTKASILLTDSSLKMLFSSYSEKIIFLDHKNKDLQNQSTSNPVFLTSSDNLAYVIYTSGSTGKPKGVMIEHRSLVNRLMWMQDKYHLTAADRVAQKTPFSFDVSVWEFFWPLMIGATEILAAPEEHKDSELILKFINKNRISVCHFVPSMLEHFLTFTEGDTIANSLRLVITSGEALSHDLAQRCHERLKASLNNLYGPTEATVDVTFYECLRNDESLRIPIGRPIANTQTYILDNFLNPVPVGVAGELYLGGVGLARGYLNRPDLTAEKFIPNPFTHQNLRLYRTGDIARYLPGGNIDFLGRIDHQVKIRGLRIELGEIESVLNRHDNIAQSLVLAREAEQGIKKLVAYIVPKELFISSLSSEELIDHLSRSVPDYMIPSHFIFLDKIPLMSNGKVDGRSLPVPDKNLRLLKCSYISPETDVEKKLASIWSEVLKIEKIGINDHFFKIGGHSLLAMQVISRVRHQYDIDLPLRNLFEHQTIADLSVVIESLCQEKNRLQMPSITAKQRPVPLPLSFAQQRLWFIDQLLSNLVIYNIPVVFYLKRSINRISLERAFNTLIERHESLRTCFPANGGKAYQLIRSEPGIQLVKQECLSDLKKLSEQEALIPFDLSNGPLIRAILMALPNEENALLVTFHHIVADGWSLKIFFQELSTLYNDYIQGKEPSLPSLSVQYADYALWQRDWMQGKILETQLDYWKLQLEGIPDLLELPADKPRPKELSYKGASFELILTKEIVDQLHSFAREQNASLFMTLLAIFQILLHRYTGQNDIVVGSPIANRHYRETENIIGLFVNTLALRTHFKNQMTFVDLLSQVKEMTLEAYQHQDVPFEQLVDYLNMPRELNRNPIFQVMFTLQNSEEEFFLSLGDEIIKPLELTYPVAKFDLSFHASEEKERIKVSINYATDLFEIDTIERMAGHFKELVHAVTADPWQQIDACSILTSRERYQLLIQWNETAASFPKNQCVHQLIESAVEAYPHSIAVVYEQESLTYEKLNSQINRLAHYLRSLGVGPETLVAVCIPRSLEMVMGILAILKAGGAYVPLDPTYPPDRLHFILQETQAAVLLTRSSLKHLYIDYKGKIVTFDDDGDAIRQHFASNPISLASPANLAYVIYTSGSTGKPKGVQITHQGLVSFLFDMRKRIGITKEEILLSATSIIFDIFGLELYLPLMSGAKLVVAPQDSIRDGEALFHLIEQENVTMMQATSTTWHMLLESGWEAEKNFKILHGGEALSEKLKTSFQKMGVFVWNLYGPTETTIWSTAIDISDCDPDSQRRSIIGRPIGNTQIYILDKNLNPLPIGVSGEIYIGGVGLARGYLNRFDQTAERFIPNPFIWQECLQDKQGLRIYQTGDLARYLSNGNIEFFGRADQQVKIRGFRIELEEIELALSQHDRVSQVVVIAKGNELNGKRLVAYLVLKQSPLPDLTNEELAGFLSLSLPPYMIPSYFMFLDKMPLTPNGKVDRMSLPTPNFTLEKLDPGYAAPRTLFEKQLVSIWSELLKVETVSINDNFFKLGGDSIISIQLVSKIRSKGFHLSVKDVFNNPTIASLASALRTDEIHSTHKANYSTLPEPAFNLVDNDQVQLVLQMLKKE